MRKIQVAIYYNEKKGFLFFPIGIMVKGPRILIEPVIEKDASVPLRDIGDSVIKSLHHSEKSLPVPKEDFDRNLVLKASGIKGHNKFNNTFKCVLWEKQSDCYFVSNKETKEEVQLALNTTSEEIGKVVLQLLSNEVIRDTITNRTFTTSYGSEVSYVKPADTFSDRGDGRTDAYQVYVYEEDDRNYLAFLIDNNYAERTKDGINKRWQQMYGEFDEFEYMEVDEKYLKIVIKGKTKDKLITSNFYQDNSHYLEVVMELDVNSISLEEQTYVTEELRKVVESIKITPKSDLHEKKN